MKIYIDKKLGGLNFKCHPVSLAVLARGRIADFRGLTIKLWCVGNCLDSIILIGFGKYGVQQYFPYCACLKNLQQKETFGVDAAALSAYLLILDCTFNPHSHFYFLTFAFSCSPSLSLCCLKFVDEMIGNDAALSAYLLIFALLSSLSLSLSNFLTFTLLFKICWWKFREWCCTLCLPLDICTFVLTVTFTF